MLNVELAPHSLCFEDEVVGVVPVGQQVGGLLVVDAHVVVAERPREEVVYLPGHVEDVPHPGGAEEEEEEEAGHHLWSTTDIPTGSNKCLFVCLSYWAPYPVSCSSSMFDAFHSEPWATTKHTNTLSTTTTTTTTMTQRHSSPPVLYARWCFPGNKTKLNRSTWSKRGRPVLWR